MVDQDILQDDGTRFLGLHLRRLKPSVNWPVPPNVLYCYQDHHISNSMERDLCFCTKIVNEIDKVFEIKLFLKGYGDSLVIKICFLIIIS